MSADDHVRVFVPGTVANLGPGFDVFGLALEAPGDIITARHTREPGLRLASITGDDGRLPLSIEENTAGIAARATLDRAGIRMDDVGIELSLEKGMPIGSGLGSSAASAAAGAFATNLLIGSPLRRQELIEPCIEAEAAVSGRHADNVAPALLGGLTLVRSVDPLDVVRIPTPDDLHVVVVTPDVEVPTRAAREALPEALTLKESVRNVANAAAFISACYSGDLGLLSRCIGSEPISEARAALVPGGPEVMAAARGAGALGSSISGAGPSIFALCHSPAACVDVAAAMEEAFRAAGCATRTTISTAGSPGARRI